MAFTTVAEYAAPGLLALLQAGVTAAYVPTLQNSQTRAYRELERPVQLDLFRKPVCGAEPDRVAQEIWGEQHYYWGA